MQDELVASQFLKGAFCTLSFTKKNFITLSPKEQDEESHREREFYASLTKASVWIWAHFIKCCCCCFFRVTRLEPIKFLENGVFVLHKNMRWSRKRQALTAEKNTKRSILSKKKSHVALPSKRGSKMWSY
jgi:hypothetical protein